MLNACNIAKFFWSGCAANTGPHISQYESVLRQISFLTHVSRNLLHCKLLEDKCCKRAMDVPTSAQVLSKQLRQQSHDQLSSVTQLVTVVGHKPLTCTPDSQDLRR